MRKFLILGIAVVLGGAALLIPAGGGAAPIGPLEQFEGRVHNTASAVTVAVNRCPNGSGNTTVVNDVPLSVLQQGAANTGLGASSVVATFGGGWSTTANVAARTFTEYATKTISKSAITVTCTGSGNSRTPVAGTVTFTSNGTPPGTSAVAVTFSLTGS